LEESKVRHYPKTIAAVESGNASPTAGPFAATVPSMLAELKPGAVLTPRALFILAIFFVCNFQSGMTCQAELAASDPTTQPAEMKRKALVLVGHEDQVTGVAFSPDGKLVASSSRDSTIKMWDAATGGEVHTLKNDPLSPVRTGHKGYVADVAFSPDGQYLASAGSSSIDNNVIVWNATTGRIRYTHGRKHGFTSIAFSSDGKSLAAADYTSVRIWDNSRDSSSGAHREVLVLDAEQPLSVAFSPDGKWLASAGRDKKLRVWNAVTGEERFTAEHTDALFHVLFSPDGKRLLTTSGPGVNVWDATTGRMLFAMNGIRGAAISPNGKLLAGGQGNLVKLWDAASGEEVISLKGHGNTIRSVAFSPDGTRLVSGSRDRTIRIWTLPPRDTDANDQ
jgi:WD40 repeat protein